MGYADGPVRRRPGVPGRHGGPAQGPTVPTGRLVDRPWAGCPPGRLVVGAAMPAPQPILDLSTLDLTRVIADQEAIRQVNPHRGPMEQLTAIVYMDPTTHVIAGYKDVRA